MCVCVCLHVCMCESELSPNVPIRRSEQGSPSNPWRDRYRAIGELRRRVSHLRIPQKSPVSGQFAGGVRSIFGILRIEPEREHSRRPRRQLSNQPRAVYVRMYVHASERCGTSGEARAVGRAAARFRLQIPLAGGCQFCRFLHPTISNSR